MLTKAFLWSHTSQPCHDGECSGNIIDRLCVGLIFWRVLGTWWFSYPFQMPCQNWLAMVKQHFCPAAFASTVIKTWLGHALTDGRGLLCSLCFWVILVRGLPEFIVRETVKIYVKMVKLAPSRKRRHGGGKSHRMYIIFRTGNRWFSTHLTI